MPKDGRYFLVKFYLREALKEVAPRIFKHTGLNDEYTVDWSLYDFHINSVLFSVVICELLGAFIITLLII